MYCRDGCLRSPNRPVAQHGSDSGRNRAEIFGHISLAQVHAALAYYHANQAEIDNSLEPAKVAAAQASWAPINRVADAREIAQGALFLASDEGSFVNCHDLVVDGGRTSLFYEKP